MTDVEDRLRGYRPLGPPADLRARIVGAPGGKGAAPLHEREPWLSWLPAAAAAAIAILFYALSANASAGVAARLAPSDSARAEAVADLATQLGGDAAAKLAAERMIGNEDSQAEQTPAVDDLQVTKND